jgi:hypothetical protein
MTPRPAILDGTDAKLEECGPTREPVLSLLEGLRQGQPDDTSVSPRGQPAGVEH